MSDLIDRQDAIKTALEYFVEYLGGAFNENGQREIMARFQRLPSAEPRKKGKWILDEDPHDGDCRCSACLIAIDQMHERNHSLLNALTGGKWWTFYKYCPNCGCQMDGGEEE